MYFDDRKNGMTAENAPAVMGKKKMVDFFGEAYNQDGVPILTDVTEAIVNTNFQ